MNSERNNNLAWLGNSNLIAIIIFMIGMVGCSSKPKPYRSPYYPQTWNVAIMPFLNHSGSTAINTMALTDSFFTELQLAQRVEVVAVNRVLAAMEQLKMNAVESPADVSLLAQELQVDAVIVGQVMGYDPYDPPRIEIRLQIYEKSQLNQQEPIGVHPGEIARAGTTFFLAPGYQLSPSKQITRVVDANNKETIEKIKEYAKIYSNLNDPAGWQTYLTSQRYLRFSSYVLVGDVLDEIAALRGQK